MADGKLTLKLFVDKKKDRVVLAESERDFVDVLFSFLTLPLGTVVRLLKKQSELGCVDKLYKSVEDLDLRFMETKACKTMLLRPRSVAERVCEDLKLSVDDTKPRSIFRCPTWDCFMKYLRYSPVVGAKCPGCGLNMDKRLLWRKTVTREDGVFVKNAGSFTISDDLHVIPTTTDTVLSVLHRYGISCSTDLEEMTTKIGREEVLYLLKRSLLSETPLTDVFLRKPEAEIPCTIEDGISYLDLLPLERKSRMVLVRSFLKLPLGSIIRFLDKATDKCAASIIGDDHSKRLKMKLVLSKSKNTILHAEASAGVVDLLFSFLTLPLGSIIKLLDKRSSSLGSVDNLYKSIEELKDAGNLALSKECTDLLLSPKLAPHSACTSQLLSVYEEVCGKGTMSACQDCFGRGERPCKHGIADVTLIGVNPKLPSSRTECGGGFTKGGDLFMVADNLEVKPLSIISSIQTAARLGFTISDLVVREVNLGEKEALDLLRASLISEQAVTDAFCHEKRRRSVV